MNFSLFRTFCLIRNKWLWGCILGLILTACGEQSPGEAPLRWEADLALEGGYLLTMDEQRQAWPEATLLVKDGTIIALGPSDSLQGQYRAQTTMDLSGHLLMPGLVNTHTHLPMTLFRGLADDLALQTWLQDFVWPAEAQFMDSSHVRLGTRLALAELIRGGVTTFNDMYFFAELIAAETKQAGLRALVGEGLLMYPTPNAATPAEAFAHARAFIEQYHSDSLITPTVAPHSPYSCTDSMLRAAQALAIEYGVPLHIHLAETQREDADLQARTGLSPTAHLANLGLIAPGLIAAHGVVLSDPDIALLQAGGAGIAHCPESNLKLASGIAPVPALRRAGVPVGLGTDGPTSNNNLSLFDEMSLAARLHKVATLDPAAMPAEAVVAMATIEGARVLGLDDRIGSLAVGKRADLIAIDLQQPHLTPLYSPYSQLVYAAQAADVSHVWVDGRCLMRARKLLTLDEQAIMQAVRRLAQEIEVEVHQN